MKLRLVWIAVLLCLMITAGCQNQRNSRRDADRGEIEAAGSASAKTGEPDASGRSGRGRRSGELTAESNRNRYHAIQLDTAEAEGLGIATAQAAYRSMQTLHSAMGKVLAPQSRQAKVSYAFPARIATVHVKIGDWVEKDQPVLTLQSEEVGRAKTDYYMAVADLELAEQNFEREKRLFDRGVGAQKNTLAREAEFKVAQANLEAAHKKLHVLGFSEEEVESLSTSHQINPEIVIYAPISGRVIEHNAVLGSMIDQSTDLMTIMDPTLLWVNADIFERDIAKIRIGQNVQVTVPAYPGEVFRGKISFIGEIMNQETRTLNVRAEVQNKNFRLKQGMFADVRIFLNGGQRVLAVPTEAVLEDNNENIVFVKTNGQYAPRIVTVSAVQNGNTAIAAGLDEGEEVVIKEAYMLKSKLYDEMLSGAHVH